MSSSGFYRALPLLMLLWAVTGLADTGVTDPVPLPLALYHSDVDPSGYWVRERLRGVRAYWTGQRLLDGDGATLTVPDGFTRGFPPIPMDGQLWMGRGSFGRLLAVVHRRVPDPTQWRSLYFMALDLPDHQGPFNQRLRTLRRRVREARAPHLRVPPHARIRTRDELNKELALILKAGGAGLILHRDAALYHHPVKDDLLMMRSYRHAQAKVVAVIHRAGPGDTSMTGLLLRGKGGRRLRLMKGFSAAQRRRPPPIGSIVEYKFYGYNHDGKPRFMSFLRVRQDGSGLIRGR